MKKTIKKTKKAKLQITDMEYAIPKKPQIDPLSVDFGREDLNQIAQKINELVAFMSKWYN